MKISGSELTISPAMAQDWLEKARNGKNRPLSKRVIARYAEEMKRGFWKANGEPIILSTEGKVLDGQHRLAAVIAADMAIRFMVVQGVREDTFDTIDSGLKRTVAQVLEMQGEISTNVLAAVIKLIRMSELGMLGRQPNWNLTAICSRKRMKF